MGSAVSGAAAAACADGRMERLLAADELFSFGAQISASRARYSILHSLTGINISSRAEMERRTLLFPSARPNELLTLFTPAEINPALRPCLHKS